MKCAGRDSNPGQLVFSQTNLSWKPMILTTVLPAHRTTIYEKVLNLIVFKTNRNKSLNYSP